MFVILLSSVFLVIASFTFTGVFSKKNSSCPSCDLLDENLRLAHQEILKAKILKRLGLPKVPNLTKAEELNRIPDPILNSLQLTPGKDKSRQEEEIFLLPETEGGKIDELFFRFPSKYLLQSIVSAQVWTKERIAAVIIETTDKGGIVRRLWRIHGLKRLDWTTYEIKDLLLNFWRSLNSARATRTNQFIVRIMYRISKNQGKINEHDTPVLKLKVWKKKVSREKRNSFCPSNSKRCCLRRFVINFRDIGWGDFILRPVELEANICTGPCDSSLPLSKSGMMKQTRKRLYSPEISKQVQLCCTARSYEPVKILYFEEENGAKSLYLTEVNDLIVTDCWCT